MSIVDTPAACLTMSARDRINAAMLNFLDCYYS